MSRTDPVPLPVGRLAPSPTGLLHLGHARSFLLAWWSVRARGGRIVLRIEDLDAARAKPGSVEDCRADLEWLGLDWDRERRSTDDLDAFERAARRLLASGAAYPCVCTRAEVTAASAPHAGEGETRYPGTCRGRWRDMASARAETGRDVALRLCVPDGPIAIEDRLAGERTYDVQAEVGDFLLRRRDGVWGYQFAVVVDDAHDAVTEVLRGDDLLPSAARQACVQAALGLPRPEWVHVPLVTGPDGERLAKRRGGATLADLRARRIDPRAVVAWAARSAGQPAPERATPAELLRDFDLRRLPRSPHVLSADEWTRLETAHGAAPAPMHAPDPDLSEELVARAARHLRDVLRWTVEHAGDAPALVVHDDACALARGLAEAYRRCLPAARHLRFDASAPQDVRAACEAMAPGSLVVLVQSTSFRLEAFRIRLELFARSIKVIEHPHLARMAGEQAVTYVDALAYDPAYYRGVGRALAQRLDATLRTVVHSAAGELVYPAGLEPTKLNVGDYRGLAHVGGQFPIGEVFTESRDLAAVHGRASVAFFGDTSFRVNRPPQPITLVVEGGRVCEALDSTAEFEAVLAAIRADEGEVWLRELGFGLNRALTPERVVDDIGTFERMCGVHLSLGAKHATYAKPGIQKRHARHHVDVFLALRDVTLDGESIHRDGAWTVEPAPL